MDRGEEEKVWKGRGGGGGGEWTICKEGGIIRLVSISPVERNFYWDRRSRRQPGNGKGWTKIGSKVRQRKHGRDSRNDDVPIVPNSRTLYINPPPPSCIHRHPWTIDASRFQLPFSAETRFLDDFRPTERINTLEFNLESGLIKLCPSSSHSMKAEPTVSLEFSPWPSPEDGTRIIVERGEQR